MKGQGSRDGNENYPGDKIEDHVAMVKGCKRCGTMLTPCQGTLTESMGVKGPLRRKEMPHSSISSLAV